MIEVKNTSGAAIVAITRDQQRTDIGDGGSATLRMPVVLYKFDDADLENLVPSEPAPAAPAGGVVLTDGDSLADLAGTPRPDNPSVPVQPGGESVVAVDSGGNAELQAGEPGADAAKTPAEEVL